MYEGQSLKERLLRYSRSADELDMVWKLVSGPWSLSETTPLGPIEPIEFETYIEHLLVTSICEGRATLVYFPVNWCVDKPAIGYDTYVRFKTAVLERLSLQLKAPILREGTCPPQRRSILPSGNPIVLIVRP
jgi:hypothetical protein